MKTELHIHTSHSCDSLLSIRLLALLCRLNAVDCIAVCDHNTISGAIKAKQYFLKHHINVIIGEEIFTADGEIIGLFLNSEIPAGLSSEETAERIMAQGGMVYIPHPYDAKRYKTVLRTDKIKKLAPVTDFIEIYNGRNIENSFSQKQQETADKYTDPSQTVRVAGSDAHAWFEVGRNYMISDSYDTNSPSEFKEAMRAAERKTAPCSAFSHFHTKIVRLFKLLLKGNFNELYRIILRKCVKGNKEVS